MFDINGTTISLTRGDTARFVIDVFDEEGAELTLDPADQLIFTMKKSANETEVLLQKIIYGSNMFHIEPQDTSPLAFGSYRYDIQLLLANGDNYTIIDPSQFVLTEEVGW